MSFVNFDEQNNHIREDHCYKKQDDVAENVEIVEDNSVVVSEDNTVVVSVGDLINKVAQRNVACETSKREICSSCIKQKACCNSKINHNKSNYQNTVKNQNAIKSFKEEAKETPPPPPFKFTPVYLELCNEHTDMYLLEDEKLVKPGDKFESHDHFVQYLNENAKRWCFYYKCTDSRKPNTENETYTYRCIYLKSKMNKYENKGLRKRNNPMKTDCPCKIKLKHIQNEKELTVVYVCNHHDHEFSVEQFNKLQHGRRLPPNIREDMMDLMTLQVPRPLIKKYVQMTTGFNMSTGFFYTIERNLQQKNKNVIIQFTEERLQFLNEQIAALAEICPDSNDKRKKGSSQSEDDDEQLDSSSNSNEKGSNSRHKRRKESKEILRNLKPVTPTLKPIGNILDESQEDKYSTALSGEEKIVGSAKCEIQKNPWVSDQCVPVFPNRTVAVKHLDEPYTDIQNESINNSHEVINNTIGEIVEESHGPDWNDTYIDEIVYETASSDVSQSTGENYTEVTDTQISYIDGTNVKIEHNNEYITEDQVIDDEHIEYVSEDQMDCSNMQYLTEVNDHSNTEYVTENCDNNEAIQTLVQQKPVRVFEEYKKDGNCQTVNNESKLGNVENRCTQTFEDEICSDSEESDNEDSEIIEYLQDESGDSYVKYDYVHKYNIDQYMTHPQFPKYIDILAKQTNTNILDMFTSVYNEKAMFQLITTQKGNVGNTKMRYIYDGKINNKRFNESKRMRLGKKLESVLILKEKIKMLKARNKKLMKRNDHLQDLAIRMNNLK